MFLDNISDQNVFTSSNIKASVNHHNLGAIDSNDSFLRSPLTMKGSSMNAGHRVCFTDQKPMTPFKNTTNDRSNIHPLTYNTEKKTIASGKHYQNFSQLSQREDVQNENKEKMNIQVKNTKSTSSKNAQLKPSFQGDRFIPCRPSNNQYELQFQHEEQLLLTRQAQYLNSQNTDANGDNQANMSMNGSASAGNLAGNNGFGPDGQPLSSQSQQSQQIGSSMMMNGATNAGDQNMNIYSNLLQTQCLGDSFYSNEGGYQNLSHFGSGYGVNDLGISSNLPIGIYSSQAGNPVIGSGMIGATSLNHTISNMMAKSKKSIFKYTNKDKYQSENSAPYQVSPLLNIDTTEQTSPSVKNTRKIPKMPFKVLDAPQLQDDFYLNLVDWSSTNILAVGLGRAVYIWSACTSRVTKLCEVPHDDSITSVGWSQRGTHLAVGTNSGDTQIWDTTHCKLVRTLTGHLSRVGCVAWNNSIVSTGSRDRNILQRDLRAHNQVVSKLVGHKQEVCGLKWSFDDMQLASGGNDNKLMVWSLQGGESPLVKFSDHTAAVKAIGWSPHQNGLLASGGGTADRCIRFWNTHTLQPINYIDTGSQVCNLMFSKNVNEIVSTHGYSLNQIIMWKYPSMQKVATLTGHTYRVLYLSMSPDGQNIVTGAGDETLRFWSAFPSSNKGKSSLDCGSFGGSSMSQIFPSSMDIR